MVLGSSDIDINIRPLEEVMWRSCTLKDVISKRSVRFLRTTTTTIGINNTRPLVPKSRFIRYVVYPTSIITAGATTVYIIDNIYYSSLITRSTRALYVLLWIAYQYGYNIHNYPHIEDLHEIASERLLQLLMKNKGLYIKLGQAIANQGTLFPRAYQERFPKLYDSAPVDEWEKMDRMLRINLGKGYEEEHFDWIDKTPVASASIAQVHKGKLKSTGQEVAIKIQHDYIDKQIVVDLMIYRFISRIYEHVFEMPLTMFTKYVSEQMITETDFVHEMHNSQKLDEFIKSDGNLKHTNVYIPKCYPELTTRQILIAEWINGISLIHKEKLLEEKFNLTTIMVQYLKLFGRQIFQYGFVHSDPHPGNLIARFDENGKQQLVLIDHGLYITIPEEFRVQYCNLWRYLFLLDTIGIKSIGRSWGINSVEIFASMVQLRPVLINPQNEDFHDDRNVPSLLRDFISDEKKFPMELPFLARTMRMIQNLNQNFGSPVNRINLLTKEAIDSLLYDRQYLTFADYWDLFKIKLSLSFSGVIFYLIRLRQILIGDRFGGKGKGLEDYIEMYMQNTAKSLGLDTI